MNPFWAQNVVEAKLKKKSNDKIGHSHFWSWWSLKNTLSDHSLIFFFFFFSFLVVRIMKPQWGKEMCTHNCGSTKISMNQIFWERLIATKSKIIPVKPSFKAEFFWEIHKIWRKTVSVDVRVSRIQTPSSGP